MDKIICPRHEGRYPDRELDCDEAMDLAITNALDSAGRPGWTIPEALDAIARVLPQQRKAYALDPDPPDDPR
jgi:hypothetical protein